MDIALTFEGSRRKLRLFKPMAGLLAVALALGSAPGAFGSTPPERMHYPQQTKGFGEGWAVSPEKGQLGIVMPVATVPGDLPIPVAYRFNATFAEQNQTYLLLKENLKTGKETWSSFNGTLDLPIAGTMHFGMIQPKPGWFPPDAGYFSGTPTAASGSCSYWVLEDGTEFTSGDFGTAITLSPNLFAAFNLGAITSAVNVSSAGTTAFYSAAATDLGSWQTTVANLTTSSMFQGAGLVGPTGYQVVMDRDKARVFAFNYHFNLWVPVLWLDRFGNSVTFQWGMGTTVPSGYSAVSYVTALNNRGNGFQVQWVTSTSATPVPLLRVDFINVQAPTLQVTGYSGYAGNRPAAVGGGAYSLDNTAISPLRPTEVRVGNPAGDLPTPAWMSAGLPQPSNATFTESWPADRVWTFSYDSALAELATMTNPMGVTTTFTWQSNNLYSLGFTTTNLYRSVATATSVDARSGITLTGTYTWSLPTTATATSWTSTHQQVYSGTGVQASSIAPNVTTYTFPPPSDPNYNNAPTKQITVANAGTTLSTTTFTLPSSSTQMLGNDQTLSFGHLGHGPWRGGHFKSLAQAWSISFPAGDTPAASSSTSLDQTTGLPTSVTNSSSGFQDFTSFTYAAQTAQFLDPGRTTLTNYQRTSLGATTYAPAKQNGFDPGTFLPTYSYLQDPNTGSQIGSQYTTYDAGGHLRVTSSYANGPLFAVTGNTSTTTFTVDATTGRRTAQTVSYSDPASGWTDSYGLTWPLSSYDTADRPQKTTDGLGVTTNYSYDAYGRPTMIQKGGQAELDLTYPNEWTTVSKQNGLTTTATLDGFGHLLTRVRGSDGVTEAYTIDTNGQSVKVVETPASGTARTTTKVFDARGRVTTLTPPIGPTISYTYSVASSGTYSGCQVVTANYSNQSFTTTTILDQWGQVLSATDPMGTVTTRTYDAMGHSTSITVIPAGGVAQTRTFTYNALGFLTSKTEPETGTQTFSGFEAHGQPTTLVEGGGRTRTFAYDGLGRTRSISNGNDSQTFNYNGLQNGTFATTSAGQSSQVVYGYTDGNGRVNVETVTPPAGSNWTQKYAYDAAGRLLTITYPDNSTATYGYADTNNYGRVVSVLYNGNPLATVGDGNNASTEYDGWGNLLTLTFASGAKNTWSFTPNGLQIQNQVITPVGSPATTRTYGYDALNHFNQAGEWTTLNHDALGRLTQATGMGMTIALQHDGYLNNISSQATGNLPSGLNNFTFNPFSSDQTPATATNGASTGWTYPDGDGDASTMDAILGGPINTALSFAWDGLGRMTSTTQGGATETYAYLPSGLRVQMLDSLNAGNNRQFAYTSGGKLLTEYTGSGSSWSWKGNVIYLGSLAIAEVDNAGIHELHSDHLGTPRVITRRSTGAVEGLQAYGPYGEPMTGTSYSSGFVPMTGYTGHVQTEPNGLIYMRGRFYSPGWHRFINSDQGADSNQLNQSAYCGGSPLMGSDPTGMSVKYWNGAIVMPQMSLDKDGGVVEGSYSSVGGSIQGYSNGTETTNLTSAAPESATQTTSTASTSGSGSLSQFEAAFQLLALAASNPEDAADLMRAANALLKPSVSMSVVPNGSLGEGVGGNSGWDGNPLVESGGRLGVGSQLIQMTQGALGNLQDWAHEGTHCADRIDEANRVLAGGDATITNANSEVFAYSVTQSVLKLTGTTAIYSSVTLWNSSWSGGNAQRNANMALTNLTTAIVRGLGNSGNNLLVQ